MKTGALCRTYMPFLLLGLQDGESQDSICTEFDEAHIGRRVDA